MQQPGVIHTAVVTPNSLHNRSHYSEPTAPFSFNNTSYMFYYEKKEKSKTAVWSKLNNRSRNKSLYPGEFEINCPFKICLTKDWGWWVAHGNHVTGSTSQTSRHSRSIGSWLLKTEDFRLFYHVTVRCPTQEDTKRGTSLRNVVTLTCPWGYLVSKNWEMTYIYPSPPPEPHIHRTKLCCKMHQSYLRCCTNQENSWAKKVSQAEGRGKKILWSRLGSHCNAEPSASLHSREEEEDEGPALMSSGI